MTRDEAVEKVVQPSWVGHAPALVDTLVELGLLKLDEPREPYEILAAEVGWDDAFSVKTLKDTLDRIGLKVVRA